MNEEMICGNCGSHDIYQSGMTANGLLKYYCKQCDAIKAYRDLVASSLSFALPKYKATVCLGGEMYKPCETYQNWFHRLMQRLILGFKWELIK